jgi:hypothetical protein
MSQNDEKQLAMFTEGKSDQEGVKKPRPKTADLLARADTLQKLCRSNKKQFAIYGGKLEAIKSTLKASRASDPWVLFDGDMFPRGILVLVSKFCDGYVSAQCEMIAELKEIQKTLTKRHVGIVISDEVYPEGGC